MLRPLPGSERARVIGLLDAFQAAERAGVEAVGRWIVACADARLRGGLRVIRARDRRHAALAEARLRSLGGVPGARPSRELAALCGVVADPGVSDRSKLALLLGRLPAREDAPLGELVRRAEGDAETRALLETIVDDERATVRWLRGLRDALDHRRPRPPASRPRDAGDPPPRRRGRGRDGRVAARVPRRPRAPGAGVAAAGVVGGAPVVAPRAAPWGGAARRPLRAQPT